MRLDGHADLSDDRGAFARLTYLILLRISASVRPVSTALMLGLLTACAGAHVMNASVATPVPRVAPSAVVVQAQLAANLQASDPEAQRAARSLQSEVVDRLKKTGVPAIQSDGAIRPDGKFAILNLLITRLDEGNPVLRTAVGFGAGRSRLQVSANLSANGSPMIGFNSKANSGWRPGLILPGGVAAATGDVVHLAIGGALGVVSELRRGPSHDVKSSARVIAKRVGQYFTAAGWRW